MNFIFICLFLSILQLTQTYQVLTSNYCFKRNFRIFKTLTPQNIENTIDNDKFTSQPIVIDIFNSYLYQGLLKLFIPRHALNSLPEDPFSRYLLSNSSNLKPPNDSYKHEVNTTIFNQNTFMEEILTFVQNNTNSLQERKDNLYSLLQAAQRELYQLDEMISRQIEQIKLEKDSMMSLALTQLSHNLVDNQTISDPIAESIASIKPKQKKIWSAKGLRGYKAKHRARVNTTNIIQNSSTQKHNNKPPLSLEQEESSDSPIEITNLISINPSSQANDITLEQDESDNQEHVIFRDSITIKPAPPASSIREALARGTTSEYRMIYQHLIDGAPSNPSFSTHHNINHKNDEIQKVVAQPVSNVPKKDSIFDELDENISVEKNLPKFLDLSSQESLETDEPMKKNDYSNPSKSNSNFLPPMTAIRNPIRSNIVNKEISNTSSKPTLEMIRKDSTQSKPNTLTSNPQSPPPTSSYRPSSYTGLPFNLKSPSKPITYETPSSTTINSDNFLVFRQNSPAKRDLTEQEKEQFLDSIKRRAKGTTNT